MIKYLFGAKISENNEKKIWFTRYRYYDKVFNSFIPNKIFTTFLKRYYDKIDKIDVSAWEAGDIGKNKNPQHFKKLTEIDLVQLEDIVSRTDKVTKILDLGCNCGRHLNFLFKNGYRSIYGVDVMPTAFKYMSIWFPKMYLNLKKNLYNTNFQSYLPSVPDQYFDLTFTRGATVELISPNFQIVREMCRVSRSYVSLHISEEGHAYPRFWQLEFARQGFYLSKLLRPVSSSSSDTLMVFARA